MQRIDQAEGLAPACFTLEPARDRSGYMGQAISGDSIAIVPCQRVSSSGLVPESGAEDLPGSAISRLAGRQVGLNDARVPMMGLSARRRPFVSSNREGRGNIEEKRSIETKRAGRAAAQDAMQPPQPSKAYRSVFHFPAQ